MSSSHVNKCSHHESDTGDEAVSAFCVGGIVEERFLS